LSDIRRAMASIGCTNSVQAYGGLAISAMRGTPSQSPTHRRPECRVVAGGSIMNANFESGAPSRLAVPQADLSLRKPRFFRNLSRYSCGNMK
jgi:hypothetical protein